MRKSEKVTRIVAWAAGELFTICSVIRFGAAREWERALLAAVTLLLLCAPFLLEKLAHGRLSLPFFLFGLFYAIGSMPDTPISSTISCRAGINCSISAAV